ncbi:MAG: hypothetical protein L6Q99_04765 [Planctomycetes bacterium]|nr:hypothetical protein [Planctomycetota bacterium]
MLTTLAYATLSLALQDCSKLTPGFGAFGVATGPNSGTVYASAVYDDGTGPALYLGGSFDFAGDTAATSIVRFDGTNFQALPGPGGVDVIERGLDGVRALAVFDVGSGPELYVAGAFETSLGLPQYGLVKWNGSTWTSVLSVTSTQPSGYAQGILALEVWNDGTGDALYFGGWFHEVNGTPVANIARYDASGWSSLGSGYLGSFVQSLAVHDDGSGPKLYVGGSKHPNPHTVDRWDGSNWTSLPGAFDDPIAALHSHDDGSGPALYAGGGIGAPTKHAMRWDGSAWSEVGSELLFTPHAFATHDDGTGEQLYAIGVTYWPPPLPALLARAARWNGTTWQALQTGLDGQGRTLTAWDSGSGLELFAGGSFSHAAGKRADGVARWTASGWSRIYSSKGLVGGSTALAVVADTSGEQLYADGGLGVVTTSTAVEGGFTVKRWTGATWTTLPGIADGRARAFASLDFGSGLELFVGGRFDELDGVSRNGIARFDGSTWHTVAGGVTTSSGAPGSIEALCVHDFGSGPELVVGGAFSKAGGIAAQNVAVWNGTTWRSLAAGVGIGGGVFALASYDGGTGAQLYAGGIFNTATGGPANFITRWNGTTWEAFGSGMDSGVYALHVADLGSGPKLYAGGNFSVANGSVAPHVAVFDGAGWQALLASGSSVDGDVYTIAAHDEGEGQQLYVGGSFTYAGGVPANAVARWTGTSWLPLDEEPEVEWSVLPSNAGLRSLVSFDDGSGNGPALFAAGSFGRWNGTPSMCVARIAPPAPCAPVVYCTSKVNSLGCTPSMYSTGSTSLAANNFRLHASNVLNNKFGLLFWSTKPNGAPFQGGHLCCKPPIVRTTVQSTTGNPPPSDCSGSLHFHWNQAYVNQLGLALGDWYYTQYWSRDPNSPSTTSLSDAIRFLLTP